MQAARAGHPFHRFYRLLHVCLCEREAREYRYAVHQNGAGTALAELASMLGTGESEVLTQELQQRLVRREGHLASLAVDHESTVERSTNRWLDADRLRHVPSLR